MLAVGLSIWSGRLYRLVASSTRPEQRFIDMSSKLVDGIVRYDETCFTTLSRMLSEERALPRDAEALSALASLGSQKASSPKLQASRLGEDGVNGLRRATVLCSSSDAHAPGPVLL